MARVTEVWDGFLKALAKNQATQALAFVADELRPELAVRFADPGADLPGFASKSKDFDAIHVMPCLVQAVVTRQTNDGNRQYTVLFGKSPDGQWKIATL